MRSFKIILDFKISMTQKNISVFYLDYIARLSVGIGKVIRNSNLNIINYTYIYKFIILMRGWVNKGMTPPPMQKSL